MNPTLQGYTAAVTEVAGSAALGPAAADLEAIEQLVMSNPQLRAALSDTAVPGPARRAVMLDLLEGKVVPEARRLAAFASGAVPAQETASALAWLAIRVRHLSEGLDEEPPLSLLAARQRVAGFAAALYEDMTTGPARVARGRPVPLRPGGRGHPGPAQRLYRPGPGRSRPGWGW